MLFQLSFIHCAMAFLFIFHYLPCSSFIRQLRAKILKEGVDRGVALSAYYVMQTCSHVIPRCFICVMYKQKL